MEEQAQKFQFNGYVIAFSKEFDLLNTYRKVFNGIGDDAKDELRRAIDEILERKNTSFSIVEKTLRSYAEEYIDLCVEVAVDILVEHGIYNVDERSFRKRYQEPYFDYENDEGYLGFLSIKNWYEGIEKQIAYGRSVQRNTRSTWSGGGFGLAGAIKGTVMAGILNTGTDIVRGIGDFFTDSMDKGKLEKVRQKLFEEDELWDLTVEFISNCCSGVYYGVSIELGSKKEIEAPWEDEELIEESDAIFSNVQSKIKNQKSKMELMCQIIEQCPYNDEYYKFLYEEPWTNKAEVKALAIYLGCDATILEAESEKFYQQQKEVLLKYRIRELSTQISKQMTTLHATEKNNEECSMLIESVKVLLDEYENNMISSINDMCNLLIENGIFDSDLEPVYASEWEEDDDDEEDNNEGLELNEIIEKYNYSVEDYVSPINPFKNLALLASLEIRYLLWQYRIDKITTPTIKELRAEYLDKLNWIVKKYFLDEYDSEDLVVKERIILEKELGVEK